MFDQMVDSIRESSIKMLLTIEVRQAGAAPKREQVAKPTGEGFVPATARPVSRVPPRASLSGSSRSAAMIPAPAAAVSSGKSAPAPSTTPKEATAGKTELVTKNSCKSTDLDA